MMILCLFVCFQSLFFSSQQQMIKKLTLGDGGFCVMKTRITSIYLARGEPFVSEARSSKGPKALFTIFLYSNWVVMGPAANKR